MPKKKNGKINKTRTKKISARIYDTEKNSILRRNATKQ